MSVEAFAQFLVDASRNSFADKTKLKKVYQDMHRPLSEYYIASSHNSSLLGNQLTSRSSSEAIKRALLLGVRMIELDAWEGEDGEPIVTHGHTLVVPTTFEACIAVVREVAFFKTKYPLILTIENHCGLEQQRRQAVILHEQLGSMLYGYDRDFATTPLHQLMEGEHAWKSPEELIGRIIIRDKPINLDEDAMKAAADAGAGAGSGAADASSPSPSSPSHFPFHGKGAKAKEACSDDDDDEDDDEEDPSGAYGADTALLALMYIKNVKLRYKISPFGVDFHEPGFCSSSSIDERKLATLTKYPERSLSLASYCCRHIIRVYPAGQRFDSSNFDPLPAWSAGVQCVALNVQKNSPAVWISHGKFRDNGGAGYVLKPPALRSEDASVEFSEPLTLKVDVLSGHYLMPAFDFRDASRDPLQIPTEVCVETSVHGVKADTINFRTRPVKRNCFNPSWNQAAQFKVTRPDLAHFLMVVKDQDGQVFYQASLALHCVREGYRVVPLSTPSLAPSKYAFLFCKFTILPMEDAQSSPEEI
ncbi:1-phosphatidylinositol 4,5-bisphosphate phosphodiesterase zeta-1 [Hondaea fermentalgiana]|uniref:Phosphoinositide phospholipase C n=1 Tax=Hondaea fermentalgiana TaxID=2315210 RepID=A0A2R5GCK0_9STRA|nr:1-phosphatidylinositol 4,5-bisphosphate phosphodiesterase zeta-1 [Hondaea fermentalgiana]|eukprot:GBG27438.1 1-phosphatidylinositol 4,5-bisphosphate phosphodiesterase zeta-1 [Hondaea fermentalgiana]